MAPNPPIPPPNGFQRALKNFESRLKPSEKAKFKATTLDDLKVTILAIQSEQRSRKQMMHMGRIMSFLEAMEQFGKVIEVFLNIADMLAFIWGPVKLLLLTAACWSESFDALLDAYQLIAENFPIFEGYQSTFADNDRMQVVLECAWSDILDFHIQALRIFDQSMLRQFFRSLWKDFRSRFQEILNDLKRQKDIVQSHAHQLHIHNYEADRLKIFEEFEQARTSRSAEKKKFVVQWIAGPRENSDRHESLCGVRHQHYNDTQRRTGQWILDQEEVKAWLAQQVPKSSSLWITAIAGAGKSILASVIIEEIVEKKTGPIAFLYCNHGDPERRTLISFMKAALSQLVIQQDHLIPYYHDEGVRSGEVSLQSTKLCKSLLRHMLQNIPKAFLIIDGLDECGDTERRSIMDFLSEVINICDSTNPGKVRVLILSRDEPDIRRVLAIATVIRVGRQDTLQDIESYIQHRAGLLQQKFKLPDADREYIEQHVLDKSDGMFLYAKLVMGNLEGQPNLHCLREEFHSLPKGLDEAYGRNLYRIQNNPRENEREIARKILSLMICSKRPLKWRELQSAISIDPSGQVVDTSRRLSMHIKDICGSLVEVLPGDRVELIHITASMYIQELGYISRFMAEHSMAILCLHYLSFECFEETGDDILPNLIHEGYFAFQDYAIAHWQDHLLAFFQASADAAHDVPIVEHETSAAFLLFADRYDADLSALPTDQNSFPDCDRFQSVDCHRSMISLWRHAKYVKGLFDDRRDEVSLPSLGRSLKRNRALLEDISKSIAKSHSDQTSLRIFYGGNWFKCSKLPCYYFHEGFATQSARQAHYDRHDRPFRCEEEDCPSATIGFGSLKELDKHKRNMHPGIDKLSSTFARLKNGKNGLAATQKYPCPRCPSKFASRLECRIHMRCHYVSIEPKARGV